MSKILLAVNCASASGISLESNADIKVHRKGVELETKCVMTAVVKIHLP